MDHFQKRWLKIFWKCFTFFVLLFPKFLCVSGVWATFFSFLVGGIFSEKVTGKTCLKKFPRIQFLVPPAPPLLSMSCQIIHLGLDIVLQLHCFFQYYIADMTNINKNVVFYLCYLFIHSSSELTTNNSTICIQNLFLLSRQRVWTYWSWTGLLHLYIYIYKPIGTSETLVNQWNMRHKRALVNQWAIRNEKLKSHIYLTLFAEVNEGKTKKLVV